MWLRGIALAAMPMIVVFLPYPGQTKDFRVSSAAGINEVVGKLEAGDAVMMSAGDWKNQQIQFRAAGTAEKPITLRAEIPGKTLLTGETSVTIEGEHVVVSGLNVKDGRKATNGIFVAGKHCRLTECSVTDSTYKFFVHLAGTENRMDHCYLAGKTSESPTLQIEAEAQPNHHLIDHNHFGPRPPLGRNGGETMRVGYSWQSMSNSATVVEHNLFDRCDGELEIISNKSCENVYRNNTFLDCAGMLTLRHGNRCVVENNFFIAHHKRGSGGIRVIGEDHKIVNNYIDGVYQGGIWITSGIENSPLKGYFRARNVLIAFNTIVDSRGPCIDVSAGMGTSQRTLYPENITIANNLFSVPENGTLLKGKESESFKWLGNVATIAKPDVSTNHFGINILDPKLTRAGDELLRPAASSPVRGVAQGKFPGIKYDIDGQPRTSRIDVGCDQVSDGPITNRPLRAIDVGPAWLERGSGSQ